MNVSILSSNGRIQETMSSLSKRENTVELLDLPDEIILAIMNKIKPQVLLLCSMIGIENVRLEQLALERCYSVDLIFDYLHSPYKPAMEHFYGYVLPCISNRIQSLALNIKHLLYFNSIVREYSDETSFNLKHLKINLRYFHRKSGTPFILGVYGDHHPNRHEPLFSLVPNIFDIKNAVREWFLSFINCSMFMHSITSIELDDDCVFAVQPSEEGLFFPQSPHLTHVRLALYGFDDCVRLFNQLGEQLHSLSVTILSITRSRTGILSELPLINCPNLKQFTLIIYRNIYHYQRYILPLLQHLSTVEHLTLLLAIDDDRFDHFIDGSDLQRDIISYMPHLLQFRFHIRSILKDATQVDIDTIRQSFLQQKQSVDCTIDYFNNNHGQCQVYSLPFIGTRLDFISNRFPLFDINHTFSNVTRLLLFDDIEPFENTFFGRVTRALPYLKTLNIFNELEQEIKSNTTTNLIEFSQLSALVLHDIHRDYAEQLLYRSHLPCLAELVIRHDALVAILANNNEQARNNCVKVERLLIVEPTMKPNDAHLNFFPFISIS